MGPPNMTIGIFRQHILTGAKWVIFTLTTRLDSTLYIIAPIFLSSMYSKKIPSPLAESPRTPF